ncbi:MAG: hypothetical protein INF88_17985 [Roseomonas sp.]|nr:hypothetical protein [Roseomonas sp.]
MLRIYLLQQWFNIADKEIWLGESEQLG